MKKTKILVLLMVFCCLSQVYGENTRNSPIEVNLIIDGSSGFADVKEEISAWVSGRLDQVLADGDTVTVWKAGPAAEVVFTGRISGNSDREAVRRSIRELSAAGDSADFSGALAALDNQIKTSSRQGSGFNYTLLISASPAALTSLLSGPQANLLRFSRVEEFSGWRAIIVGLNLDTRVSRATASFLNTQ